MATPERSNYSTRTRCKRAGHLTSVATRITHSMTTRRKECLLRSKEALRSSIRHQHASFNASGTIAADRNTATVAARWGANGCGANYPMALDEPSHRLFIGCRRPASLATFDAGTGRVH